MKNLIFMAVGVLIFSCQPNQQKEGSQEQPVQAEYQRPEHHSDNLTKVLDAHGGYEQWLKIKSLSYKRGDELTITNPQNRKIRLESPAQTIGFDGQDIWVTPDSVDASRARFYHNLYFYFYAMPFVIGDPGAYYEDMESKEIKGKMYNGIKVSYQEDIGDAPDDNYIIWYDTKTNKMEWLMYTVTYRSGESNDNYNLIKYDQWGEFNGIILPTVLQWYQYDEEVVGDARNDEMVFDEIRLSEEVPDKSLFEKPEDAQIAPK